jgi:hypothetical protein
LTTESGGRRWGRQRNAGDSGRAAPIPSAGRLGTARRSSWRKPIQRRRRRTAARLDEQRRLGFARAGERERGEEKGEL